MDAHALSWRLTMSISFKEGHASWLSKDQRGDEKTEEIKINLTAWEKGKVSKQQKD